MSSVTRREPERLAQSNRRRILGSKTQVYRDPPPKSMDSSKSTVPPNMLREKTPTDPVSHRNPAKFRRKAPKESSPKLEILAPTIIYQRQTQQGQDTASKQASSKSKRKLASMDPNASRGGVARNELPSLEDLDNLAALRRVVVAERNSEGTLPDKKKVKLAPRSQEPYQLPQERRRSSGIQQEAIRQPSTNVGGGDGAAGEAQPEFEYEKEDTPDEVMTNTEEGTPKDAPQELDDIPVHLGRYPTYPPATSPKNLEALRRLEEGEDHREAEPSEEQSEEDVRTKNMLLAQEAGENADQGHSVVQLEDYRGDLRPPTEPYRRVDFPKPPPPKTVVEKHRDIVKEWEQLVKKHEDARPRDDTLLVHARARLRYHRKELERAIEEEPHLTPYREQRLEILRRCLQRFEVPEEIVNVKAAIQAFETGVLGNDMELWTVFYNGHIVDTMNTQYELLWSVRKPLYEELYGKEGGIWIEPPANYVSKACAMLWEKHFVSGVHWYIWQNIQLPWYPDGKFAKEFEFLVDTGATDPTLYVCDFLDLGMVKKNCPHVSTKNVRTANGDIEQDFYPVFINHIDRDTNTPLYLPMDTIASVQEGNPAQDDRLSGLDLWRFLYVASEPSTGVFSYTSDFKDARIRHNINPGNTLTPRAWYTLDTTPYGRRRRQISQQVCDLTFRKPRLLNPAGDRWVIGQPYNYQWGESTRTPPKKIGYLPGHKVHPPTPDSVRRKRRAAFAAGKPFRDNRHPIKRTKAERSGLVPGRDNPAGEYDSPPEYPDNPHQYLEGDRPSQISRQTRFKNISSTESRNSLRKGLTGDETNLNGSGNQPEEDIEVQDGGSGSEEEDDPQDHDDQDEFDEDDIPQNHDDDDDDDDEDGDYTPDEDEADEEEEEVVEEEGEEEEEEEEIEEDEADGLLDDEPDTGEDIDEYEEEGEEELEPEFGSEPELSLEEEPEPDYDSEPILKPAPVQKQATSATKPKDISVKTKNWLRGQSSAGLYLPKSGSDEDNETAGFLNLPEVPKPDPITRGPGRYSGVGGGMDISFEEAELVKTPNYYRRSSFVRKEVAKGKEGESGSKVVVNNRMRR